MDSQWCMLKRKQDIEEERRYLQQRIYRFETEIQKTMEQRNFLGQEMIRLSSSNADGHRVANMQAKRDTLDFTLSTLQSSLQEARVQLTALENRQYSSRTYPP